MRRTRLYILLACLALAGAALALKPVLRRAVLPLVSPKSRTVEQRLKEFGEAARNRMKPAFEKAGLAYPPRKIVLLGLKAEHVLQIYGTDQNGQQRFVCAYPIFAASSFPGPKLREGDGQVPEGIYPIDSLNPNSAYHVSLRIGYPNPFDKAQAAKEARTNLGGDIMIHGNNVSVGCLAMGDQAAEDLFTIAADVGIGNVTVILSPVDFRTGKTVPKQAPLPQWTESLYSQIKSQMAELPLEASK